MATYAVGDLQGCLAPLKVLLEKARFNPKKDTLWLTGDLVNRGGESLECLRFVRDMGDSAVTILGNHDLHLLAIAYGNQKARRKDTLQQVLDAPDCDELLSWLVSRPLIHFDKGGNRLLVHAGLPHTWTLKKALKRAAEVEAALADKTRRRKFFKNMYGNLPASWSADLTGDDRLRVITNYLTRMRFISKSGELELVSKCSPSDAPPGYKPWFQFDRQDSVRIVFGHWAALQGLTRKDQFEALDTGCVWGNCLTLKNLDTNRVYTANCAEYK
ncbi:MAG: diadenosine tetraphosphatase [Proteobacteria bacterium]|nr:MAG: diadenosine tetraphosphatase [Pseudomonadota bacterium]PIE40300.1 MAG: diadenosine tetraphosphatase [Gammaproteobacteria bacterium]